MLNLDEPVYRPPSERNSLLIQVTIGCSHNKCNFCGMYQTKKFIIRKREEIFREIEKSAEFYKNSGFSLSKAFLCDGDALTAPTELLVASMEKIKSEIPSITRFGIYGSIVNLMHKTLDELIELKTAGLNVCYVGLESGCDHVLSLINKGNDQSQSITQLKKLRESGIKISLIILIGIGGTDHSFSHALESAKVINQVPPEYLSFLTVTVVPKTPLDGLISKRHFTLLSHKQQLIEMREILKEVRQREQKIIFRANHVSNHLPLEGILPRDNAVLLGTLDDWIAGCPDGTYPTKDYRDL